MIFITGAGRTCDKGEKMVKVLGYLTLDISCNLWHQNSLLNYTFLKVCMLLKGQLSVNPKKV